MRKQNLLLIRTLSLFDSFVKQNRPAMIDLESNADGGSFMMRIDESLSAANTPGVQTRLISHTLFSQYHASGSSSVLTEPGRERHFEHLLHCAHVLSFGSPIPLRALRHTRSSEHGCAP